MSELAPAPTRDARVEAEMQEEAEMERIKSINQITANARLATEKEHNMTLMQGVRLYPKAVFWSMFISTCIIMEGYQLSLTNNFYAFPQFNKKYGTLQPDGTYSISAAWQAGLSNGANVGEMIGLLLNGFVSERYGYRYTVMACLVLISAFIAIFFCAPNIQTLQAAEVLAGIPWGVFQTLTITYASEVCPVALRGYLTCYVNCCWGIGQLIGIGVIKGNLWRTDEWAYRIPYALQVSGIGTTDLGSDWVVASIVDALQWMWPLPIFIGVAFAPESPWWLVRKGRIEEARRSLLRLTSLDRETDFDPDETVDMMRHTTELEQEITTGASYLDCFRGVNLRRTEIVCMVWAMQNLSGNSFSNYSTYFLEQAGLDQSTSYNFAMGQYAINCVGVFGAWALMAWGMGRRTLFLTGLCGLCAALFVMGFLGLVPAAHKQTASLVTGIMMIVWALFYQLSVGTIAYSLVAEISTRRLQIKTVVLGRNLYLIVNIICSVLTPYMLNPTAWNWGNYAGFFWGGSCALCVVYTYFRVPEPSGRTFAELDVLFERKVPARKFKTAQVDAFDVAIHSQNAGDKPKAEHVEKA
ncbi:hypothetical protein JCM24511_09279 [Saitozyma sp. JCM 24511]|nr:hypothetical protein JCM24511_09279 [Saitozyma sp. JCM 24511]